VDNSFDDYTYPIEGKENAPENERYETLHFTAGPTQMDGKLALKFVRSRHGNNNEGTDFARAKRQQKVMLAVKDKAMSAQTLLNPSKLSDLYDAYSKNVDTDIDFGTAQGFYLLSQKVDFAKIKSIVLDDRSSSEQGGLLYSPTDTSLYGGAYVLIPRAGDYSQLHAYVQRYIFGE
jgi:polyisoprenyl-teichoic acid--peptidoglycan teichoic acid transferase